LVVSLDGGFCQAKLLLHNLRLYSQVRELVSKSLGLYPQGLTLLFSNLELLLHHDPALYRHVVFRLDVLQR
jgi:hypothetical protein